MSLTNIGCANITQVVIYLGFLAVVIDVSDADFSNIKGSTPAQEWGFHHQLNFMMRTLNLTEPHIRVSPEPKFALEPHTLSMAT